MATVKSKQVTAREATPARPGDNAGFDVLYAEYSLNSDGVTNTVSDVIQMIKLEQNEKPVWGALEWDDLATGTLTLDVGNGTTPDALLDGVTGSAAGYRPFIPLDATDNAVYDLSGASDTIDVTLADGGAAALIAGRKIRMWIGVLRNRTGTAN